MTDAELSRQLALALGYFPESVLIYPDGICQVYRSFSERDPRPLWLQFDYRSPDVAMPLLVWLMKEHDPMLVRNRAIPAFTIDLPNKTIHADTLEEAIARACIAVGVKP